MTKPSPETFRLCRVARAKFDAGDYRGITEQELDAMAQVEDWEMWQRMRAAARVGSF